jgi:hypothetical protein
LAPPDDGDGASAGEEPDAGVGAFKKGRVLFIECKRKSGDSTRPSQRDWLFAALKVGFTLENFLILEWTAAEV